MTTTDVAIVGAGFAGSILARALRRRGRSVVLLERGRHPRFALGESSTPLAAIALERLAEEYDLADLDALAAWGRWGEALPELGRGLKRGFSFYRHRPGRDLEAGPDCRLLVAASPDDAVADSHWVRADVDAFLVERAVEEGVDYRDGFEVREVVEREGEVVIGGRRGGQPSEVRARFVVDASGPTGVVAGRLGATRLSPAARFTSGVVFSHFSGVEPLAEVWRGREIAVEPGPYPDERAAVHHLLEEGWVYVLPFDHGVVSAGAVLYGEPRLDDPDGAWRALLARYPTLARQFERAEPVRPIAAAAPVPYRRSSAAGRFWAALPHAYAFFDPMFSTGIAWSLVGVERLAAMLSTATSPDRATLETYATLLAREADQIERLIHGAGLARGDFGLFAAHSQLYFALVSFAEVRQRVLDAPAGGWAADGFLGAGDRWAEALLEESLERLSGLEVAAKEDRLGYETWVAAAIASRNVAGLADPVRRNLYPVDLELLVARADLLGLEREEMRALLPRLRGRPSAAVG